MNSTAKTLLLGIGGFGGNILGYLQKNTDSFILPNNYSTLIFSKENDIKDEKVPDFSSIFEEYQRIIIFAGIGGTHPSTVLQTILKQEKLE
jgi:hypothetical protein